MRNSGEHQKLPRRPKTEKPNPLLTLTDAITPISVIIQKDAKNDLYLTVADVLLVTPKRLLGKEHLHKRFSLYENDSQCIHSCKNKKLSLQSLLLFIFSVNFIFSVELMRFCFLERCRSGIYWLYLSE